ncbi:MAG TPA: TonB-dependent receptor [Opitutus sp.]|nr:TonB-dependent receptor [Opitutus sp.]
MVLPVPHRARLWLRLVFLLLGSLLPASGNPPTDVSAARVFAISSGDAASTLDEFTRQSGVQLVYLLDQVRGQNTRAVAGRLSPEAALHRMLAGTALIVRRDHTGAFAVVRRADPRAQAGSPATIPPAGSAAPDIIVLPEFTVSTQAADRYRVADAISAVRIRAALIDTPSSISVITRDTIDDLAPTRIFDVARFVAGVQEGRGNQFQDRMILRGFESNGQRTVDNFLQADDADNLDEVLIERVEIAKGPNAILSPAGAPGGSINVITKSPSFDAQRSLSATVGLFDAQKIGADLTGPLPRSPNLAYRLIASVQDSRRYPDNDARLRGKVFAPMFSARLSDRTQLTVKLIAAEHWIFREPLLILDPAVNASTPDPFLAPRLSSRTRNGIQPWSHVGTHTADAFALLTSKLSDHLSLRAAANGRYYFEDSQQEFLSTPSLLNRYNPFTGELTQDYTWDFDPIARTYLPTHSPLFDPAAIPVRGDKQATRRKTVNLQVDAVATHRIGAVFSQTVAGFALSRRTTRGHAVSGSLPSIDLSRPDFRAEPVWSTTPALEYDNQFTNWHTYLNQRIALLGERVQLTGGVLHYHTDTRSHNRLSSTGSWLNDNKAMWLASVLLKPRPDLSFYYSHSTNSSPIIANDIVLWRDGVQDEIGFKSEFFAQRLSFAGAWFTIAQTNVPTPNPARQTDPSAPESLVSDLKNHGVELELVGGLTPRLSVIATFSQLRMRDNLGRRVRAVADRNSALLLNYRLRDGLAFHAGVNYSGARAGDTPINFTPLNVVGRTSFFLRSYYITTAGLTWRWNARSLFRLNVDNVLDDGGYLQQAGSRVSGTGLSTAPGLNVKLTTTVNF